MIVIVEATIRFPLMRITKLGKVTTEKQSENKGEKSQNKQIKTDCTVI